MRTERASQTTDWRAIGLYLLIAYGGSWLIAGLFRLLGGRLTGDMMSAAVGVPYMLVPMVAAYIVQKRTRREPVAGPLGISFKLNWWWLAAWLGPLGITLAALGVSLLLPGIRFSPELAGLFERYGDILPAEQIGQFQAALERLPIHPFWLLVAQGLIASITVNAVAGFGEELGWRGLLWRELRGFGFWGASLLTGLVWGIWHLPLVLQGLNYRSDPIAGIGMMTAWCILLSPLFSYIRLRTGSVIGAAIFHGSFNAFRGLALIMTTGGSDLLVGVSGLAGFAVLAVLNLLILAVGRPSVPTLKED